MKNKKRTTKIFLFLLMNIIFLTKIEAKLYVEDNIDKSIGVSAYSAYMNKNGNPKNIVVCAYETPENGDSNIITYSIDKTVKDKWTISTLKIGKDNNILYTWNGLRNTLPPVYFESYEKDQQEVWNKDLKSYADLQQNFICPSLVYIDEFEVPDVLSGISGEIKENKQEMELCYENRLGTCEKRNTTDTRVSTEGTKNEIYFNEPSHKTYSLDNELYEVLNEANKIISDTQEINLIKPMLNIDSESEEDSKDICNIITSESFANISSDTTGNNNYRIFLDKTFETAYQTARQKIGEYNYNSNLYTYDNLSNLFIGNENIDITYDNIKLNESFELIQKIYAAKIGNAYGYYKNYCSQTTGKTIKEKQETIEKNVLKSLQNMSKNSVVGETLNCENVFSNFATEIKTAYFFIEILSIVLVVALSALEYAKIIMNDNQEEFKKANKKLARRIIVLVALFLLPAILNMVLGLFKIEGFNSENPLCINVTEK